jgi:hypothetical protein
MRHINLNDLDCNVELEPSHAARICGGMGDWAVERKAYKLRQEDIDKADKAAKTAETAPQETVAESTVYISLAIIGSAV